MEYNGDNNKLNNVLKIIYMVLEVFLSTLVVVFVFVVLVVLILLKGPSTEATKLFTLSAYETSAMKWVPLIFLSQDEYDSITKPQKSAETMNSDGASVVAVEGNTAQFPIATFIQSESDTDSNYVDNNLPDLEIIDLVGGTYKGKLMIVRDPSRVKIASIETFGGVGKTLSGFVEEYDAIACTNAGGFEDEDGKGKGGIPEGLVIRNGQIVYGSAGSFYKDVIGFDTDNKLHVGNMSGQEALNIGLDNATSFENGPVLIKDGVRQTGFVSGINPRTCIGQTADGAVLLIAIEGRMADSLGATFDDLADIMEKYGAVNAGNFDGGSSSGMYYEGERITRSCSVIGDRPLPTAVIVSR